MKDYKLSEVQDICLHHGGCSDCPFQRDDTCMMRFFPENWELEFDEEPAIVHTMDNVNHPSHYASGCGFECFEMMRLVFSTDELEGFCLGNAFKYIWRHEHKGGTEDLLKARWYLETVQRIYPAIIHNETYKFLHEKIEEMLTEAE